MKKNKYLPLVIVGVVLLIGFGVFAFTKMNGKSDAPVAEEPTKKKRITQELDTIPVEDRPYIRVLPQANGRNVEIHVINTQLAADTMEYELEYQAGTLLQGAFGSMEVTDLPAEKDILLGSCSAGGACTYHEDVRGGTLLVNFTGGDTDYAHKTEWKYIINSDNETAHSSKDAKFQIESDKLARVSYIIIYRSPGAPADLTGTINSNVYSMATSNNAEGEAELTMRLDNEIDSTIMGYDGSEWIEFETTVDGKTATATVELMEAYVAISK